MAAAKALILLACITGSLSSTLPSRPVTRNTIFSDEKFVGEPFEKLDSFTELRNTRTSIAYRLPGTTKPSRYTVLWSTDFVNFAIGGSVSIELYATQDNVSSVVIHCGREILYSSVTLYLGTTQIPVTVSYEDEYEFLRITLDDGVLNYNEVNPPSYTLSMNFQMPMRTDMYGIYRTWYKTGNETRWMVSTQFQSTSSRDAFPCYDEPGYKAYFDITIRRPSTYRSWSNMRIASTVVSNVTGYEEDIYHTTPYMSTYLIAIIVSEYSSLDVYNSDNLIMYDVIARPDAISQGQGNYSLDVGQKLLAAMSEHTDIDFYSVDANIKMTQAAIPDFDAGAMENWGLLTYREAYLMLSEEHTSHYFRQIIAYILSHEITHMWFGNLVTCNWWDVLWLNEGFARYYQYFLTGWVETEMGFETRFITEQVHTALLTDSASAHPLSNTDVYNPNQVAAMFSTISYNKGAAIIRMTEHLLGTTVHTEGLRSYLRLKSFDTALPIDLFQALEDVAVSAGAISQYGSNFSLVDYYTSWTYQPGHPILTVSVNHSTGDMTIQQRRFNINTGYSSDNMNYIIPITFSTASNPDFTDTKPSHIISASVSVINRGTVGDEWVIFNRQQTGFYRVNYDDYTWNLITIALRSENRTLIHEYNRAQIVNDVFQFARSGIMTYNRAFNILSFLENETDYAPWVAAMTGFTWLRARLAGTAQLEQLHELILSLSTNVMSELGYTEVEGESFMRAYLRYQLTSVICAMNHAPCKTAAVNQFSALMTNSQEVSVNNRLFVYCNGLREGSSAEFDYLWNRFQNHQVYTEKITLLQSLGCTSDRDSLFTLLDGIVNENELVRPQDYTTAYATAVQANEENTNIVFEYVQQNLTAVYNAFNSYSTPLSYISARLRTHEAIDEFEAWATANQATLGDEYQTIINGAENSRFSLNFAASISDELQYYFTNGNEEYSVSTAAPIETTVTTTVSPPAIEEEVIDIPDSAATAFLSVFVGFFAVFARFLV